MDASDHDYAKELTRKLYWAVSSTFPLTKQQRATSFTWAADMADRMLKRLHPSHPLPVDKRPSNGYHGQADGRGGGRYKPSIQRGVPPQPLPNQAAWELDQAAKRKAAWAYVLATVPLDGQLPIPPEVFREVGNGRSNSTG